MAEQVVLLDEPPLAFAGGHEALDPHDGLSLFGPFGQAAGTAHVVIGRPEGLALWEQWQARMNRPAYCRDRTRHRAWPPFPGFDVAFGRQWPAPVRVYSVDGALLAEAARRDDRHERAGQVVDCYMAPFGQMKKLDATPSLAVCVVPDAVYQNCRPQSTVTDRSDEPRPASERKLLAAVLNDRRKGQQRLFSTSDRFNLERYGYSPDFRRQLKARVMPHGVPVQIVRESTLTVTEQVEAGEPGTNPLSDRLWNLTTGLAYKTGQKPWKLATAREGVCYVGLAFRQTEDRKQDACCAAQLFLDTGDGVVFVGEFGPWYSPKDEQFHLTSSAAEELLRGTIRTYEEQGGRPLTEIFLHAQSSISEEEYRGYLRATPPGCRLVAVRVRQDPNGPRLFRNGDRPPLRGMFWQRTPRSGLLYTTGFIPRLGTYAGFETPVPLSITVQHGEADIRQIAADILGLTKLNYNACGYGEAKPITVVYSEQIGEILLANRELAAEDRQHTFRFYI